MELRAEKIYGVSGKILSILFTELATQEVNAYEVLSGTIYATEKFTEALSKLEVVPKDVGQMIHKEVRTGAIMDLDEALLEKLKTLLVDESQKGE